MSEQMKNHIIKLLKSNTRLDGRGPLDYREPIEVEYDISKSAEGSAKVTIGETEVIAGVKMEVMKPYADQPDAGSLMVNVELLAMSSPEFEVGPPTIQAIELARVTDRGIRESHAIDMKKLCIREGELVWMAVIDICVLNDAGNLFDASSLASLAALSRTKLPVLTENDSVDYKNLTEEKLPLSIKPVGVTVLKIGDSYIVDPTFEEEAASDARLTVASTKDGTVYALQKGGDAPLSIEDIDQMVGIALEKAKKLGKLL